MNNYSLALSSWGDEELQAIQDVIAIGIYSMNRHVSQFEKDFASLFGSKYAVMVNSGSSANLLAIAALFFTKENALKAGDEVIVPAVSWSTTYAPLQQYGLKVRFVDVDINTLNISLDQLKEAITDKTKVIFLVNLLGNPNDFAEIEKLIEGKNITLIEDNCESMGAEYRAKKTGTFGVMGTFSTFFSHHISTMEGGVVVTDDEELYHILLSIRAHGWTRNLPADNLVSGKKDSDPFKESFKFVLPGYNLRPLEFSGAIGIKQLEKLPGFVEARRRNAQVIVDNMSSQDKFIIQQDLGRSSWFGFSFIINPDYDLDRASVLKKLGEHGVESRPVVTGNFTLNPVIKYFDYEIHDTLKNADIVHHHGFFIGNHHVDYTSQIAEICSFLSKI